VGPELAIIEGVTGFRMFDQRVNFFLGEQGFVVVLFSHEPSPY
jgi:uncharacterized membrane protein